MTKFIYILALIIILGIVFRIIFIPILKEVLNDNCNIYLRAHRQRMRSHLPTMIIPNKEGTKKKDMIPFYTMETELELYRFALQDYCEENHIPEPSMNDIAENSTVCIVRREFGKPLMSPHIYIVYNYDSGSFIYTDFRNPIDFSYKLLRYIGKAEEIRLTTKDNNFSIQLIDFVKVLGDTSKN